MFDVNDFDETLPGPFEYDVKRMAASFTIAARNNGFTDTQARDATTAAAAAYREAMAGFVAMGTMDIWYAHLSEADLMAALTAMTSSAKGDRQESGEDRGEERTEERGESPQPRQLAGAGETDGAGRWPIPDRQPTASRRPGP